ncbi:MAG: hypothetical protein NTX47_00685 [Candidatus Omnitrophica bacterium]|nr:hypothetical protein [Candidatus Omnitrophota bacterium]
MKKIAISIALFSYVAAGSLFAAEIEDSFGSAKKIESKYFTIHYLQQIDISKLSQQLNITTADKILAGRNIDDDIASEHGIAGMIDILYSLVGDMVDMHVYNFKGNIKICLDQAQLNNIYRNLFDKDLLSYMVSFYVNDTSTIYISEENFRREVLGHEIAHAIINHYFVVSPPIKVQEILSKYIEYQLRKTQ